MSDALRLRRITRTVLRTHGRIPPDFISTLFSLFPSYESERLIQYYLRCSRRPKWY